MIKTHVASYVFKCFRCFRDMLQMFHMDLAKVDRAVASILEACYKILFKNVSSVVISVLIWMLHIFYAYVARVCSKCFNCFSLVLH